jgi:hypothetical protein
MYLTATSLPSYLIGRGLVDADAVVDGDLAILEAGRRNRNFKVFRGSLPGLFVKQVNNAASWEPVVTVQREASLYGAVKARPSLAALSRVAPRLVDYNPVNCSLITELVPDGESFAERYDRTEVIPEAAGAALGYSMAIYHSLPREALAELASALALPVQIPWVLNFEPMTMAPLSQFGAGGPILAAALQIHPALYRCLIGLRYEWTIDSFIHSDIKLDNLVISEESDVDMPTEVRVVDWELGDLGDASWDVGGILASAWVHALLPLAVASGTSAAPSVAQAQKRLVGMQPALRRFWAGYVTNRGLTGVARPYLERSLRFAAGRLVLSVFEFLHGTPQMNLALAAMLKLGEDIALNPGRAASELIGL